jgi:hypothetical protein
VGAGSFKKVRCTLAIARSLTMVASIPSSAARGALLDLIARRQAGKAHSAIALTKGRLKPTLLCLFLITTRAATTVKRLRREKATFLRESQLSRAPARPSGGRFLFAADRGCRRIFFLPFRVSNPGVEHVDESEAKAFGDLANLCEGQWRLVKLMLRNSQIN